MAILKKLPYPILVTIAILMVPLIAMQFTNEVQWSIADFLIASLLIFSISSLTSYICSLSKTKRFKATWLAIVTILFILIWAELAVGIFNSPIAGN